MDKRSARQALEALMASDGWNLLIKPRAQEAADSAVAELLYARETNVEDLATVKGFVKGILCVLSDLPGLLEQELAPDVDQS